MAIASALTGVTILDRRRGVKLESRVYGVSPEGDSPGITGSRAHAGSRC
ncbi:MAG: hypothetical protein OXI70_10870 [Chloroflexota bacterium]|nr:hypothetical protein [Chloroflexota bacterium]